MNIIEEIKQQIRELQDQIAVIQNKCSHPVVDQKWYADEDEYGRDNGPGSYSITCKLCEKHWSQEKKW